MDHSYRNWCYPSITETYPWPHGHNNDILYNTKHTYSYEVVNSSYDNMYISHSSASFFKSNCFQRLQKHKQTCTQVNEKQNSPLWEDSLLSATFLSAETMASEGTRGLSTYLGFLIGPASTNRRHRENDTERERECVSDRERERGKNMQKRREWEKQKEREREFSLD